jgi:hypothetical protein
MISLEGRLKSHPSFTSLLQNNLFRETIFFTFTVSQKTREQRLQNGIPTPTPSRINRNRFDTIRIDRSGSISLHPLHPVITQEGPIRLHPVHPVINQEGPIRLHPVHPAITHEESIFLHPVHPAIAHEDTIRLHPVHPAIAHEKSILLHPVHPAIAHEETSSRS